MGRHFSYDGITATAHYDDGSSDEVDEIYLSCDPDPLTKGTTSVRVTCSFEGKTVSKSFDNIVVNEAALVSLVADSDARKNMMLAAHSIGLGSRWIHREKEMFGTEEGKALMKKWGVPENCIGVGALALGYPDGEAKEAAPRNEDRLIFVK